MLLAEPLLKRRRIRIPGALPGVGPAQRAPIVGLDEVQGEVPQGFPWRIGSRSRDVVKRQVATYKPQIRIWLDLCPGLTKQNLHRQNPGGLGLDEGVVEDLQMI